MCCYMEERFPFLSCYLRTYISVLLLLPHFLQLLQVPLGIFANVCFPLLLLPPFVAVASSGGRDSRRFLHSNGGTLVNQPTKLNQQMTLKCNNRKREWRRKFAFLMTVIFAGVIAGNPLNLFHSFRSDSSVPDSATEFFAF